MVWKLQSYWITVLNERTTFGEGSKHTVTPSTYFRGSGPPTPYDLLPCELLGRYTSLVISGVYYAPAPNRRGIRRCFVWRLSVWRLSVCLSVAYIGPKSRTERPRKTKIGTEVAHVTRDSVTTYKVKRSRSRSRPRRGHIVYSLFSSFWGPYIMDTA